MTAAEIRRHGAFEAGQGINPFADSRILFEQARVHEIHAAGPGDLAVNNDNFAMHTAGRAVLQNCSEC